MSDEGGLTEARMLRLAAAMHDVTAARLRLSAVMIETAAVFRAFVESCQAGFDRDVAEHPDLAELNVMMDGYYDTGSTP